MSSTPELAEIHSIALIDDLRGEIGISEEDHELQRAAEDDLRGSRRCRHLDRVGAGDSTEVGTAT